MRVEATKIEGVLLLRPEVFGDGRGWFSETWSARAMAEAGLSPTFVQDNESWSERRGTLRGIHFQRGDKAQGKLVRCARGVVLDVAVDLRPESPTYGEWTAAELSEENHAQLWIPRGLGHAFLTLTDGVLFCYKADSPYAPEAEGAIRWNDPDLAIDWPAGDVTLSDRDARAPWLRNATTGY